MYKDEQSGQMIMRPVLWTFRNGTDWKLEDGQYHHPLGPDVKTVTQSYQIYYTGLSHEGAELKAGDYVLEGKPQFASWNTPIMATVLVNDTPLNSFLLEPRQIVVTQLLKQGKNEIRIISTRVKNSIADNDIEFTLGGPAEWNVERSQFLMRPVVDFKAKTGWTKDPTTGALSYPTDPTADSVERVIPFFLKEAPVPGG